MKFYSLSKNRARRWHNINQAVSSLMKEWWSCSHPCKSAAIALRKSKLMLFTTSAVTARKKPWERTKTTQKKPTPNLSPSLIWESTLGKKPKQAGTQGTFAPSLQQDVWKGTPDSIKHHFSRFVTDFAIRAVQLPAISQKVMLNI